MAKRGKGKGWEGSRGDERLDKAERAVGIKEGSKADKGIDRIAEKAAKKKGKR